MARKTIGLTTTIGLGLLVLTFQNCAPASFANVDPSLNQTLKGPIGSNTGSNTDVQLPEDMEPGDNNGGTTTPPTGQPPRNTDGGQTPPPKEQPPGGNNGGTTQPPSNNQPPVVHHPEALKCDENISMAPPLIYDSLPKTDAPESLVVEQDGERSIINAEKVSRITQSYADLSIVARRVNSIDGASIAKLRVNADEIGHIRGSSLPSAEIVVRKLNHLRASSIDLCASVHEMGDIEGNSGRMTLFGRKVDGRKAQINHLRANSGFFNIHDFDIQDLQAIQGSSVRGQLVRSHMKEIRHSSLDLVLVDTVVESIKMSSGTIHLRGSSKILEVDDKSSLVIVRD